MLFGTPEIDWYSEAFFRSEPFDDDRVVEVEKREWEYVDANICLISSRDRLHYFLTLRKANPEKRKLKLTDLDIPEHMVKVCSAHTIDINPGLRPT